MKEVDFAAIMDHLGLSHIIKSKTEPATNRIKRLLDVLSSYAFNLNNIRGKDMILSDFSYRQKHDESVPPEIIPISFNIKKKYYMQDITIYLRMNKRDI